eukprot:227433-Hanusia_phi.AAC.7
MALQQLVSSQGSRPLRLASVVTLLLLLASARSSDPHANNDETCTHGAAACGADGKCVCIPPARAKTGKDLEPDGEREEEEEEEEEEEGVVVEEKQRKKEGVGEEQAYKGHLEHEWRIARRARRGGEESRAGGDGVWDEDEKKERGEYEGARLTGSFSMVRFQEQDCRTLSSCRQGGVNGRGGAAATFLLPNSRQTGAGKCFTWLFLMGMEEGKRRRKRAQGQEEMSGSS